MRRRAPELRSKQDGLVKRGRTLVGGGPELERSPAALIRGGLEVVQRTVSERAVAQAWRVAEQRQTRELSGIYVVYYLSRQLAVTRLSCESSRATSRSCPRGHTDNVI